MPESKQETSSLESTSFMFSPFNVRSRSETHRAVFPGVITAYVWLRKPGASSLKGSTSRVYVIITISPGQCNKKPELFSILPYLSRIKEHPARDRAGCSLQEALTVYRPQSAIFTATSRAIFIMLVNVVCRSAGDSSSPVTRLSEMEQMASARLPV